MDHLLTEARNPASVDLDALTPIEIVRLMNAEDAKRRPRGRGTGGVDRAGDRGDRRPPARRRAARLRGGRDVRPARRARRVRMPAHLQLAARPGHRRDRRRVPGPDHGRRRRRGPSGTRRRPISKNSSLSAQGRTGRHRDERADAIRHWRRSAHARSVGAYRHRPGVRAGLGPRRGSRPDDHARSSGRRS